MRILFIRDTTLGMPGAADAHYIPITLAKLGYEVTLVARSGGDASSLTNAGVEVMLVDNEQNWISKLRHAVCLVKPDIVHVFIKAGCGFYPLLLRDNCRAKFILDIRSPLLRRGLPRVLHRIKNIFEPLFYDAITAHGIESAWTVMGKRHAIHWVPPGVDLSAMPQVREKEFDSSQPLRLVYIGSLNRERNIELMLEGFRASLEDGLRVKLDVFGSGTAEEELGKMISEYRLDSHIQLKGHVEREKLFIRLKDYDAGIAFVPNGIYEMAPPLKTVEFLACGLPVLASDTFGNRMFIEEGINGFFFENNTDSIKTALKTFISYPDREAMSHKAIASAQPFDWSNIVRERLIPVYEHVLQE